MFILRAQPHAQSLFLFPIVLGINLIHFFRWEEGRCSQKFDRLFRCFDPLSHHLTDAKRRTRTVSKSATFLATESVNSASFKREETKVQIFRKEKCKTLRQYQGKVQNSSPISALLRWRHFRLSLSLSLSLYLSLYLSHRAHLTHNIGSASALPIIGKFSEGITRAQRQGREKRS